MAVSLRFTHCPTNACMDLAREYREPEPQCRSARRPSGDASFCVVAGFLWPGGLTGSGPWRHREGRPTVARVRSRRRARCASTSAGPGSKPSCSGHGIRAHRPRTRGDAPTGHAGRRVPAIIELVSRHSSRSTASPRGFPGVVADGVIKTAPNLHEDWQNFALAKLSGGLSAAPCACSTTLASRATASSRARASSSCSRWARAWGRRFPRRQVRPQPGARAPSLPAPRHLRGLGRHRGLRPGRQEEVEQARRAGHRAGDPIWNPRRSTSAGATRSTSGCACRRTSRSLRTSRACWGASRSGAIRPHSRRSAGGAPYARAIRS